MKHPVTKAALDRKQRVYEKKNQIRWKTPIFSLTFLRESKINKNFSTSNKPFSWKNPYNAKPKTKGH